MTILDNLKKDVSEDASKAKEKASVVANEVDQKLQTNEGRKWVKYTVYVVSIIVVLMFGSCMIKGCSSKKEIAQTEVAPAVVNYPNPGPVVIQQQSGLSTGEALALGALGGYIVGQSHMPDGSVYRGTPEQQVIVKKYYISHPEKVPAGTKPVASPTLTATPAPPVNQKSLDQKEIKKSADAAAEAEKKKMQAEQAEKDRQAKLKEDLKAKQAARAEAQKQSDLKARLAAKYNKPVTQKSSFNSFSKKLK